MLQSVFANDSHVTSQLASNCFNGTWEYLCVVLRTTHFV